MKIIKKSLCLMLAVLLVISLFSFASVAFATSSSEEITIHTEGYSITAYPPTKTAELLALNGSYINTYIKDDGTLILPETLGGYTITGMSNGVFCFTSVSAKSKIKNLVIPDTIKYQEEGIEPGYDDEGACCNGLECLDNLESVTIPADFRIPYCMFSNCTKLKSVNFKGSISEIPMYAFFYCTALEEITIPEGVTGIGEKAFLYCKSLKKVTIPTSVKGINNEAFRNCSSLESVIIPNGVTEISGGAFRNCTKLKSVQLPESLTAIGERAFCNCSKLESITLPKKLKTLDNFAFYKCSSLSGKIEIPKNTYFIGDGVFAFCSKITGFKIAKNNKHFSQKGGVLFDKDKTTLYCYPALKATKDYKVPSSVKNIRRFAFAGATNTEKIRITKNITVIQQYTFYKSNIKSIELPNSIEKIRYNAFEGCKNLKNIKLPSNLKTVGKNAFKGCTKLEELTFPKSVTRVYLTCVTNCKSLKKMTFKNKDCKLVGEYNRTRPLTVYGYKNSTAYKFALKYKLSFVKIK